MRYLSPYPRRHQTGGWYKGDQVMNKSLDHAELTVDSDNVSIVNISRRGFLKDLALSGFVLAAGFPALTRADETAAPTAKISMAPMPCRTAGSTIRWCLLR